MSSEVEIPKSAVNSYPAGWGEGHLIHYHTIPTFDAPEKEAYRKHCGKRRKCWLPAFSSFPAMFSTLHKTNFKFSVTLILSSAIPFNFDKPKLLSFGNGLNLQQIILFL